MSPRDLPFTHMTDIDTLTPAPGEPPLCAAGLACARGEQLLFRDLSLALDAGQALQVYGANGSGKTTLLRVLCGLTLAVEGEVRWRGRPIDDDPARYRSEMLYLGHVDGIKLELTARENLRFARALGATASDISLEEILARIGLDRHADVGARALSAGQRRRIALGRLLATRASVWILDEPFTALDRQGTSLFESLLDEHLVGGGLAVFSSHQPLSLAGRSAKGIALGADGPPA